MNRPMLKPTRRRQGGFSLIELMVAMAVSLILLLGILSLLLANKDSYRTENEYAALQQNARLARFVLENTIEHAGYIVDLSTEPQHAFAKGFMSDDPDPNRASGKYEDENYDSDSDSITIRFRSDGGMNNCLGTTVGSPQNIETAHFELYVDENNQLQCTVYDDANSKNKTRATEPLVDNVVLMQVRYGLDSTPDDGKRAVDQYTTSLDEDNQDQVRTVRIQLLLGSKSKLRTTSLQGGFDIAGYGEAYIPGNLFIPVPGNQNPIDPNALTDPTYHAYVMVDQVIALRNLLP